MHRIFFVAITLSVLLPCSLLQAHYLWVVIDKTPDGAEAAKFIFEEGPSVGDGSYLDHFTKTSKTWLRTVDEIEPRLLEMRDTQVEEKRWLQSGVDAKAPRSIDSYGKFGVYAYGKTNVLLHYYARYLDVSSHEDLHELGRARHLDLELSPHDVGDEMVVTVRWKGKPAAGRTVYVRGPRNLRTNLKTDERGKVRFKIEHQGRYTTRTFIELEEPGTDNGDDYSLIRHHGTLIMNLPLEK